MGRVKFYADEDIDMALIHYLRSKHKISIVTASELGYQGRDDEFHFQEAYRQKRFLLTRDRHYLDHSRFPFNQMLGVVILDIPPEPPGLGWMAIWLQTEIVPSGKGIRGTKIVLRSSSAQLYFMDQGQVLCQTLPLG